MDKKGKKVGIFNKGKGSRFIDNTFVGLDVGIQDEGRNTLAKGNQFFNVKERVAEMKQVPLWLQYAVAIATIFGAVFGGWGLYIVLMSNDQFTAEVGSKNATSTIAISTLLTKALTLGTVVERQDFLIKYIGSSVNGRGMITEVTRGGSGFIVDIGVSAGISTATLTCLQEATQEMERQLPLLKGKAVKFSGTFTYQDISDHGMEINDCVLTW